MWASAIFTCLLLAESPQVVDRQLQAAVDAAAHPVARPKKVRPKNPEPDDVDGEDEPTNQAHWSRVTLGVFTAGLTGGGILVLGLLQTAATLVVMLPCAFVVFCCPFALLVVPFWSVPPLAAATVGALVGGAVGAVGEALLVGGRGADLWRRALIPPVAGAAVMLPGVVLAGALGFLGMLGLFAIPIWRLASLPYPQIAGLLSAIYFPLWVVAAGTLAMTVLLGATAASTTSLALLFLGGMQSE